MRFQKVHVSFAITLLQTGANPTSDRSIQELKILLVNNKTEPEIFSNGERGIYCSAL